MGSHTEIVHTGELAECLVPEGTLALNSADRILTLLSIKQGVPLVIAQSLFSLKEWSLLVALLEAFPSYASYEVILTHMTPCSVEEGKQRLEQARVQGTLRALLGTVRETVKALRPKVACFPFTIVSVVGCGYRLVGREITPY